MPTILVVDRDTDTLAFAERTLTAAGHKVEMATSARAAMAVLARAPIDVILLEMLLPDMEGVETILEVKRRWPDRPVAAMCGGGAMLTADHALRLARAVGAGATLPKPFSATDLMTALDQALAGAAA